jgi:predicted O-methyltransferase YrrM
MLGVSPGRRMTIASLPVAKESNWLTPFFAGTVFVSAALVFMVEPLFAKMILPQLGGSPAVWNACMAFFQAALLAGYLYAHLLQRLRTVATQILIHLCLLAAAALVLPITVTQAFGSPPVGSPVIWLLCVLTVSIGAPFAVLSASAPLLQAWYARLSHDRADNPYVLYSASNLGSMLALLAYPTLVEPLLTVHAQSLDWTRVYCCFAIAMVGLGAVVSRKAAPAPTAAPSAPASAAPTWSTRILWLMLSAAPSSLMLGATTYISDDVASVPFLWVIPLALYLLTFVISFQSEPAISRERALFYQAIFVPMAAALFCINTGSLFAHLVAYTGAFFFSALVCHQRLAAKKPSAQHLTEFYLMLSLGGVLGGMFNAFLAPLLFSRVAEFPLVLGLAMLARPWWPMDFPRRAVAIALFGLAAIIAIAFVPGGTHFLFVPVALAIAGAAAAALVSSRALLFILLVAAFCLEAVFLQPDKNADLLAARSFFGVYRVTPGFDPALGDLHLMFHGTTIHGAQPQAAAVRCRATTYYAQATPLGQAITGVQAANASARIGVVGLGVGTVATYLRTADHMRFFEIDPEVERIARDRRYFTYLSDCMKGSADVVLGDARLTLAREKPASYDMLMLDAFSADTVPTHLLTVEALGLYLRLLKPNGVLVLHLSNRNLALEAPAAAGAKAAGAIALMQNYVPRDRASAFAASGTQAMLIAKSPAALASFARDTRWRPARDKGVRAWNDDYTNVFGALLDHALGR